MKLTLAIAQEMVTAALAKAQELGQHVSVAVVDPGGLTMALARMERAIPLSFQVAEAKAVGAALWRKNGDAMEAGAAQNPAMFQAIGALPLLRTPLIPSDGSCVVTDANGLVVAAVGVSGGPPDADRACAEVARGLMEKRG